MKSKVRVTPVSDLEAGKTTIPLFDSPVSYMAREPNGVYLCFPCALDGTWDDDLVYTVIIHLLEHEENGEEVEEQAYQFLEVMRREVKDAAKK